jgi:hypothetical protein
MFGLAMCVATVFLIPPKIEPAFWLAIFVICAVIIAKQAPGKYFLHGLCVSLFNSVWMTAGHVIFFDTYAANHLDEMSWNAGAPLPPRVMMLVLGPIIGLVSGTVLGLFSLGASKLLKPKANA